jgi:Transposase IS116/IS110/IS902 family
LAKTSWVRFPTPNGCERHFVTRKTTLLVSVPLGVDTFTLAVVAPSGILVLISDFDTTLNVAGVPLKVTPVAWVRSVPKIIAAAPTLPEVGRVSTNLPSPRDKLKIVPEPLQLLLQLMLEKRFPRIWVPDAENRDLRQLLWHRHRLVQMRTRVMKQLQVVGLNEGLRRKKTLWRAAGRKQLESIALAPWAARRRQDLLDILDQLTPKIQELTRALEEEVEKRPVTRRLMTHPGVGPLTALAFELVIGTPERFHCGKQIASYVGLVPEEKSSGDRCRLGHISKQGNVLLRFLLVEAAQVTVRSRPAWRSKFFHLAMRRGRKIAKVAMARKLAVHLY